MGEESRGEVISSRQTTTIAVLVTMRLPVGTHAADGIEYVKAAVNAWKGNYDSSTPIAGLAVDEIQVKLVKKETHYL